MRSISLTIGTFFLLLATLFVGMYIGGDMEMPVLDTEKEEEELEKEKEVRDYDPVLDHEKAVMEVVEENLPSVVSIVSSRYVERMEPSFFFPHEGEEREETEKGTGFIISEDGLILTNRHIVEEEDANYTVFLHTGEEVEAEVLVRDPVRDLAILRVEGEDLPSAKLGDSDGVEVGQTAIAIGYALGELENTVSSGIISGLGRQVTAQGRRGTEILDNVIQTDAAINFGNSGGPLLNLDGEVVGINTATAVHAEGIGFAIPVNDAQRVIEAAREGEDVSYPFLGIRYLIVNEEVKKRRDLPVDYGALVDAGWEGVAVEPGSAADEAGIEEGDIILEFDGERISEDNHLATVITNYRPGDEVDLEILREGEEITRSATLGEMER